MDEIKLRLTTPKRLTPNVRRLIDTMRLTADGAVWLKLYRPRDFVSEPAECHINILIQQKFRRGALVSGWTIWQDFENEFVEAQFHSVWRDPQGNLRDITPRQDREQKVLFVPDESRHFKLTHVGDAPALLVYETVRMHRGSLLNGPSERIHVCVTKLLYQYGLVSG